MKTLSTLMSKTLRFVNKHGSLILSIGAGVCMIGAVVSVADATSKTMSKVHDKRINEVLKIVDRTKQQGREPNIHQIVDLTANDEYTLSTKEVVKTWALPVGFTAGALSCIIFNYRFSATKEAALIAAATSAASMFATYRNKALDISNDVDDKIVDEIVKSDTAYFDISDYFAHHGISADETVTFYDENVGGYFEISPNRFLRGLYHFQREIVQNGYVSLTKFYDFLGLKPDHKHKEYCDMYGWDQESICEAISSGWLDVHIEQKIIETPEGESDMIIYEYYMDFDPVDLTVEWIVS